MLPEGCGGVQSQDNYMCSRRCSTERRCRQGTDSYRMVSATVQKETPEHEDTILVPFATRARIPCLVHTMAKFPVLTAFGEHAALHVFRVFDHSMSLVRMKVWRMSYVTDHWDNRRLNTSPSLWHKY